MKKRWRKNLTLVVPLLMLLGTHAVMADEGDRSSKPALAELTVTDRDWDNGETLVVEIPLSPERFEALNEQKDVDWKLIVGMSEEYAGAYKPVSEIPPDDGSWDFDEENQTVSTRVSGLTTRSSYYFRAYLEPEEEEGEKILLAESTVAVTPRRQWFLGEKASLAFVGIVICGSVILFIEMAKRGRPLKIRKIAGLDAVDEAVGRATEMGRSVLYIAGIQDMNDIQTIAGLNILSRVARVAAEFDAEVEVPTSRALVMTAARETMQGSYLAAGRPDAYNPDLAYYVTDEQFGFVAAVSGNMVREKPAACFYLGAFYAESLILAETGNSIGAIQVAGTAEPSQLPFFVAACDYTLIGEELFAASAYLSGAPEELGSLKGQDVGKVIVAIGILAGCLGKTMGLSFLTVLPGLLAVVAAGGLFWWLWTSGSSSPPS